MRLTFYADEDGDHYGRLVVEVQHEGFGGISESYFDIDELLRFAEQLGRYPLPDPAPRLVGGYGYPEVDEVHLLLMATQISPRGQVGIDVLLRSEDAEGPRTREVHLTMPTTYGRLDTFHQELTAVVNSRSVETGRPWC
jgi:hypothetical protein